MKSLLLFQVLPYFACALCAGVLMVRALAARPGPGAAPAPGQWRGGRAWRVSLVLLLLAHLLSVASPRLILAWNAAPARLYVLEVVGLLVGLAALAGGLGVLARHWRAADRRLSVEVADSALLSLLLLALASGAATAVGLRWGSSWAAVTLTPYLRSLLAGHPQPALVERLPPLVQLHVAAGFGAVAVLPFTSLAPALVHVVRPPLVLAARLLAAAAAGAAAFARRRNPAAWLWPDEDYGGPLPPARATRAEPEPGLLADELGTATLGPAAKG
jgi:nitrate reductase gamma subunit